jgi:hypothetical protein
MRRYSVVSAFSSAVALNLRGKEIPVVWCGCGAEEEREKALPQSGRDDRPPSPREERAGRGALPGFMPSMHAIVSIFRTHWDMNLSDVAQVSLSSSGGEGWGEEAFWIPLHAEPPFASAAFQVLTLHVLTFQRVNDLI